MGLKARTRIIISCFLFFLLHETALAKNIYCWKNKQKIRECGQTVPPEYAQQRIEVINEHGMVIKVLHARKTKAQLAKEAREAEKKKAIEERRRQDLILLKTYVKEEDMLATRDKQLAAIDSSIKIAKGNLRFLNDNLVQLQKQAANHERGGSKIPGQLLKDIKTVKSQITENNRYLVEKDQRKKEIKEKFADDLVRYRKMKQVKPR